MPDCGVHYLWFAFVCFLIRSPPPLEPPFPLQVWNCTFTNGQSCGLAVKGGGGSYDGNVFTGNCEEEVLIENAIAPLDFRGNRLHCLILTDPKDKRADKGVICDNSPMVLDHNGIEGYRIGLWLKTLHPNTLVSHCLTHASCLSRLSQGAQGARPPTAGVGCSPGRAWPMARIVALADPTQSSGTGDVWGLRWHNRPGEGKGVIGRTGGARASGGERPVGTANHHLGMTGVARGH